MAYAYDENSEMNLKDYFQKYRDKLPRMAVITGGVYGKTKFDDFATDQIVRFHRHITQQRVIMMQSTASGQQNFSIPVSTDMGFQVVKGRNKMGPTEDLKTILKQNKLPVLLNIVSHVPPVIDKTQDGHCQLLVTEEYTQYYLQGHCIGNNRLTPSDVSTIIVIPEISVADIDGFVNKSKEKFEEHLKHLTKEVSTTRFNDDDVDKDIRVIEDAKTTKTEEEDQDSDREYEYIEPPLPLPRKSSSDEKTNTALGRPLPPTSGKTMPPIPPRGPLPTIPSHEPLTDAQKRNRQYENEKIKRCEVNPIVKQVETDIYEPEIYGDDVFTGDKTETTERTISVSSAKKVEARPRDIVKQEVPSSTDDHDVSGKNITEIIEILNKLKLGKYSEMFEGDMVDGMTLKEFTEEDLKKEYGMRHAEAVRLMNYVRSGHIPK